MSRFRRRIITTSIAWINKAAQIYKIPTQNILDALNQNEYTFVKSIHCNSTHYIDTNYIPTSETGMMLCASNIKGASDTNFVGCRITSGARFMINSYQTNYVTYGYNTWDNTHKLALTQGTDIINTITLNYQNERTFRCNASSVNISETFNEIGYSIYIGAQHQSTSATTMTTIEHDVNAFSITEGNECKQFLLPCIRNADNVSGMYDIISKQFFTNVKNTNFICGDKITLKDEIIALLKRYNPNTTLTLYDYLESTGIQYINTQLSLTKSTGTIEIKFSPTTITATSIADSAYNGVVGANSTPQIGWYTEGWTVGNAGSSKPYIPQVGTIYTATWGYDTNEHLYIDGQDTELSRSGTLSVILFYVASKPDNAKVKVYYCKITDTKGNVTHNFLPCTYGENIGMYDTVEKMFYSNAGSGEFILGNKI